MRVRRSDGQRAGERDEGERDTGERGAHDDWFVRAAGFVGDLGNPFYAEERQRDVWNEASAVGFQAALWLGLLVAAAAAWLGGPAALPGVVAGMTVLGAASLVTLAYVWRVGVDLVLTPRMLRLRLLPLAALLALLVAGTARAAGDSGSSFGEGFAGGLAAGALLAALAIAVSVRRARRDDPGR